MGIRPEYDGLTIDPCIPAEWNGFTASRKFRGKTINIKVENPNGVQKGIASMAVNGTFVEGNTIPAEIMKDENEVVVVMG